LREFRAARGKNLPAVFTFHNVSPVCATDTLMRCGSTVCDGVIRRFTCSRCYLHNRGHSRAVSLALASVSAAVSPLFRAPDSSHRWRTLSTMFAGFERRRMELTELAGGAAALVAPARFLQDVLMRNGIDGEKIVVCRQGVPGGPPVAKDRIQAPGLRIGYVGRLEFLKGADIIAEAVCRLATDKSVTLEIIGSESGVAGTRRDPKIFMGRLRDLAARDSRIQLLGRMPYGSMREKMASFDLLAVPSRTQETGPMSAMEALALGVPVLGSDLGGIPETVQDGVNGRILTSLDPAEWSRQLDELLDHPGQLAEWKKACRAGRTMGDVAGEMLELYRRILSK
jgi:glycosyltransferase involved in cell wall biosynthesis